MYQVQCKLLNYWKKTSVLLSICLSNFRFTPWYFYENSGYVYNFNVQSLSSLLHMYVVYACNPCLLQGNIIIYPYPLCSSWTLFEWTLWCSCHEICRLSWLDLTPSGRMLHKLCKRHRTYSRKCIGCTSPGNSWENCLQMTENRCVWICGKEGREGGKKGERERERERESKIECIVGMND